MAMLVGWSGMIHLTIPHWGQVIPCSPCWLQNVKACVTFLYEQRSTAFPQASPMNFLFSADKQMLAC